MTDIATIAAVIAAPRLAAVDPFALIVYLIIIAVWLSSLLNQALKSARKSAEAAESAARSNADRLRAQAMQASRQTTAAARPPAARAGRAVASESIEGLLASTLQQVRETRLQTTVRFHADRPDIPDSTIAAPLPAPPAPDQFMIGPQQPQVPADRRPSVGFGGFAANPGWPLQAIIGASIIGPPVALRGDDQLPVGW